MPQMSQVLSECAIGMLTVGMSTRAFAIELNVNFSTISHLQHRFREFGSTPKRPEPQTMCNHASPGPPHLASSPVGSSETSHLTADETVGLHNQRISAQTVRNHLREANLGAYCPDCSSAS